ncbi:MAG: response regulator [Cyanobacteria bacterium CRU_2_1]|nr:response regulator [Cyanobacteria bacterium RU_5_0]NJR58558.1 response regulator [Cyanobacteria bacterium CRU_2_1]
MDSYQRKIYQGSVLVVDDTPNNLRLLTTLLRDEGYEVRAATNGQMALTIARTVPLDLILLDISMPDVDGYEVCRQLKANENTQSIPVIFISVFDEVFDKVQAFAVGGIDYVTKPFHLREVVVRVKTHLNLGRLQQQIQEQNTQLRQAEAKYRSIFEHAIEGIFQMSPDGRYLDANPALARLYGYSSPQDLMNSVTNPQQQLYLQPERWDILTAHLQLHDEVLGFESQIRRRDGSMIWITENIRAIRDANRLLLYYEGMVQDITVCRSQ